MGAAKAIPNLRDLAANAFRLLRGRRVELADAAPKINARQLAAYMDYYTTQTNILARSLSSGNIDVAYWRREMRKQIEHLHTTGAIIGRGGVDNLDANTLRAIDRKVSEQYEYLEAWARDIQTRLDAGETLDEDAIRRRAGMYGTSVSSTVYEQNTAVIGLPRLPQYPGDGATACLTNCRCSIKIERLRGNGNFNVYWKLGAAEHCDDCIELSRKWSPLKIRNGVIINL